MKTQKLPLHTATACQGCAARRLSKLALLNLLASPLRTLSSFLHIWQADLAASHPGWPAAEATLSAAEQGRQARLHTVAQRQTYGRAHGFLRAVLAVYTRQSARLLAFPADGRGKPQLPGLAPHFNLSYRPGRALVAVSDAGPVGADVEKLAPLPDAAPLVSELFSPAEQAALHAVPPDAWQQLFYTIWTRKEAYAKALGMGLAIPFAGFSVLEPAPGGSIRLVAPAGARLRSFAAGAGYQGAVALLAQGSSPTPQHFDFPFDLYCLTEQH